VLTIISLTTLSFACVYSEEFYRDFDKPLSAQSIFSDNIFFCRESSYFKSVAELKPPQRTWSPAVEDKFYFIFHPMANFHKAKTCYNYYSFKSIHS